jgi:Fe-Mn family superoxide dismutase
LVEGTDNENKSLEEIIMSASGGLFNNAAQVWNHTFYWNCMRPNGGGQPTGELASAIKDDFGSFDAFKEQFTQTAITTFGSGWAWLVKTKDDQLKVINTSNAGNPLNFDYTPLLTCDMWEHAFYIDYRNAKAKYLEAFWSLINWDFVASNLKG